MVKPEEGVEGEGTGGLVGGGGGGPLDNQQQHRGYNRTGEGPRVRWWWCDACSLAVGC